MSADGRETLAHDGHSAVVVVHSAASDVGRVRQVNEDSFLAEAPVFLVADGMGGHARGDAASRAVVETFRRHLGTGEASTPEQVLDAIHSSNDAVRALSEAGDEGVAVAGTTLAGVALIDAGAGQGLKWMAFNVGDSRVYSWDGRRLIQVSVDHSAVQELVDAGLLEAAEAERHPERNVITRALGADEYVEPDVWILPVGGRQAFLVCSDGLTKEVGVDDISRILAEGGRADELIASALAGGGRDNVTAVLVESDTGIDDDGETTRDRDGRFPEETAPRDGGAA
ncbi:PP2C family protein-serine/threonine phosphatase [Agromyces agglutinans]|uniref:PP2C family protein-serine/threonine phosphatase n=1 Tax=Agromyces agglutinans TaxID=2662258 RepID=UPI0028B1F44D|nr:protein phosphatase 2C domain-containing protein [Agromyces agglutinans]